MNTASNNKFDIQESQYEFPYHYIPHFQKNARVSLSRKLRWGMEYLCYQKHIQQKVADLDPSSVLEVGCGDGYFIGSLPSTIGIRLGVDLSDRAIGFAKAFHPDCDFRVQDIAKINNQFEVVVAIEVVEHIPDHMLPGFFKCLADRVTAAGVVILSVPTTVLPLNKKHYRHYSLQLLKDQLAASECGLVVETCEYIYTNPWWFGLFTKVFDNRLFSLEVKPFMRFAWNQIWKKYRVVDESVGFHLVAVLKKK